MSEDMLDESSILIVPYFTSKSSERQEELNFCLEQNIRCSAFSKVVLLVDDGSVPEISSSKLEIVATKGRPTYRSWIDVSRTFGKNQISVLANSDIFFNKTAWLFREALQQPAALVALTRYEKIGTELLPHPNPHWSQDVWAIRNAHEMPEALYARLRIPLGVPRCDNKIAYLFKIHGWRIINPFKHIIVGHAHETQIRTYDKKRDTNVLGGVAYVYPSAGLTADSDLDFDVWSINCSQVQSVKLNRSLEASLKESTLPHSESGSLIKSIAPKKRRRVHLFRDASRYVRKNVKNSIERLQRPSIATNFETTVPPLAHLFRDTSRYVRKNVKNSVELLQKPSIAADPETVLSPLVALDFPVKERPGSKKDFYFWQYPCATEKQAYENHLELPIGSNFEKEARIVNTYLGLPWATFIDKNAHIAGLIRQVRAEIDNRRNTAAKFGYELRVHSVCQHYAWHRLKSSIIASGVTDLHLSHCVALTETTVDGRKFRIHSWPLFATNIENPLRSIGMQIAVPAERKQYIASFIGAYMPHYRSDVRLALQRVVAEDGGSDVILEVNDLWHFNNAVYVEQVQGTQLAVNTKLDDLAAAARYNHILSESVFSLCPEGAGPNSLRLWESLAVGSIPVVISDDWVPPILHGTSVDLKDACIFISSRDIETLLPTLRNMDKQEIMDRQRACLDCYLGIKRKLAFGLPLRPSVEGINSESDFLGVDIGATSLTR